MRPAQQETNEKRKLKTLMPMGAAFLLTLTLLEPIYYISSTAHAGPKEAEHCAPPPYHDGAIKEVAPNGTLIMEDETKLRLANIIIIDPALLLKVTQSWQGKKISYHQVGDQPDHLNRRIAQIFSTHPSPHQWLQAELLQKGAALVFANDDNKACYDILLAKETQARQVNAGLWARKLGVKDKKEDENEKGETNQIKLERNQKSTTFFFMADDLAHLNRHPQGEFVITRGKVVGIGHSGLNSFINFSRNWKEDFTILIEKRHFRQKSKTWPELETLTGKTIEVRGWLDHWNGPMIRLDIPEMLRLVDQEKENE